MKSNLPLVGLCLLVSSVSADTATVEPTIRTANGVVRGVVEGDVWSFKGIPFAAPPVGENRWRSPQPLPPWQGVRDASKFGADCAQVGFTPGATSMSMSPTSSENCLYINLWRPANVAPAAKLPVMVWIFGGGFVFGSGAQPSNSGVQFAKRGVILLAFNYRVGRLGFFAFPALSLMSPRATTPTWTRLPPSSGCNRTSPRSEVMRTTSLSSDSQQAVSRCTAS